MSSAVGAGARRRCVGVILAGGGATRYGGLPKGLERVGGVRIIDRVREALAPVCDELLLVANQPDAGDWLPGVRTVADVRSGEGALGGVHAALWHAAQVRSPESSIPSDSLVLAWDMPFLCSALLEAMRAQGEREGVDAVLPESAQSRRGLEPLCAWYAASCLAPVTEALERGDRRVIGFHERIKLSRFSFDRVKRFGDPAILFANVNTPAERERWDAIAAPEDERAPLRSARPPMLSIVGKKHAGKTTLTVRLAAELIRRGRRVMTLKHGSHTFNIDPSTTDTYRHYHEGNVERVAMASPDKFALVSRWERELPPEEIAVRYLAEAELVLCEGFKASALPKVEVIRRAAHAGSLLEDGPSNRETWRAIVSDAPVGAWEGPRFDLDTDGWLAALADWVEREFLSPAPRS